MDSNFIKAWRKRRGLTQAQVVARMTKNNGEEVMTQANYSRIESGKQDPFLSQLRYIATALHVDVCDLTDKDPDENGEVADFMRYIAELPEESRDAVLRALRAVRDTK